LSISDMAHSI